MDLNKTQGRQLVPTIAENETGSSTLDKLEDPIDFRREEDIHPENETLHALRNKTIRCTIFEQYRAYLKCPLCPEYATCAQLKREQRNELQTSPFFSIKEIIWENPRRIKTMYIAVCTDGSLRRLDNFDPKNNDGMNLDEYKDVEQVLVVTKAFRRKVIWAPVPMEEVKANQGNGGSNEKPENLIKNEGDAALTLEKGGKGAVKAKNGKKK
jgi:hypothetical protein